MIASPRPGWNTATAVVDMLAAAADLLESLLFLHVRTVFVDVTGYHGLCICSTMDFVHVNFTKAIVTVDILFICMHKYILDEFRFAYINSPCLRGLVG